MGGGRLAAANTRNDLLAVVDSEGKAERVFAGSGRGDGELDDPEGLAFSVHRRLYVADQGNNRVAVYSEFGVFLHSIGASKDPATALAKPVQVAVDGAERVYVLEQTGSGRISIYDRGGRLLKRLTPESVPGSQNARWRAIAADLNGRLFVADSANGNISEIDWDGAQVRRRFGSPGKGRGQFSEVRALAITGRELAVADAGNGKIEFFRVPEAGARARAGAPRRGASRRRGRAGMRTRLRFRGRRAPVPRLAQPPGRAARCQWQPQGRVPRSRRIPEGRGVRQPRHRDHRRQQREDLFPRRHAALHRRPQRLARRRVLRHRRHASRRLPVCRRFGQPPRPDLHARRHPGRQDRRRPEHPDAPFATAGGCRHQRGARHLRRRRREQGDPGVLGGARVEANDRRRPLRDHPEPQRRRRRPGVRAGVHGAREAARRRVQRHGAGILVRCLPRAEGRSHPRSDAVDPARRLRHRRARRRAQAARALSLSAVAAARRRRGGGGRAGEGARRLAQVSGALRRGVPRLRRGRAQRSLRAPRGDQGHRGGVQSRGEAARPFQGRRAHQPGSRGRGVGSGGRPVPRGASPVRAQAVRRGAGGVRARGEERAQPCGLRGVSRPQPARAGPLRCRNRAVPGARPACRAGEARLAARGAQPRRCRRPAGGAHGSRARHCRRACGRANVHLVRRPEPAAERCLRRSTLRRYRARRRPFQRARARNAGRGAGAAGHRRQRRRGARRRERGGAGRRGPVAPQRARTAGPWPQQGGAAALRPRARARAARRGRATGERGDPPRAQRARPGPHASPCRSLAARRRKAAASTSSAGSRSSRKSPRKRSSHSRAPRGSMPSRARRGRGSRRLTSH